MHIIALDDEKPALNNLISAIHEAAPGSTVAGFTTAKDATEHARQNSVDVAFLDIRMPVKTGLELAHELKELNPNVNIVFVTGYTDHMTEAFSMWVSGYIVKPVTPKAITEELQNLRYSIEGAPTEKVEMHTFGNFDVFVDGKPIVFKRTKAKEILAYLVDRRGGTVNNRELASILWEQEEYTRSTQKQLQVIIAELMRGLKNAGVEDIIIRQRNSLAVIPAKLDCDYYQFLAGEDMATKSYQGEYMANYAWGKATAKKLSAEKGNS